MRSSSASKSGSKFSPLLSLSDSFLPLGSEAGKSVIELDGLQADGLVVNSDGLVVAADGLVVETDVLLVVVEVATGYLTWDLMDLIISCTAVTSALPW